MDITIKNGRAIIAPLSEETDKDPNTNKPGIRTYSVVLGVVLKFFGFAEKVNIRGQQNKPIYLNRKSLERWLKRHDISVTFGIPSDKRGPINFAKAIKDAVAFAECSKKITTAPSDAKVWAERGRLHWNYGNLPQAIQDLSKAIENAPSELIYLEERSRLYIEEQRNQLMRAGLKSDSEQLKAKLEWKQSIENAIKDCTKVYEGNPKWTFTRNGEVYSGLSVLLVRASLYELLDKSDLAFKDFNAFLLDNPQDQGALYQRGNLYFKQKNYDEALKDYDAVLKNEPKDSWALGKRAQTYFALKRYQDALNDIEELRKKDGSSSMFGFCLPNAERLEVEAKAALQVNPS